MMEFLFANHYNLVEILLGLGLYKVIMLFLETAIFCYKNKNGKLEIFTSNHVDALIKKLEKTESELQLLKNETETKDKFIDYISYNFTNLKVDISNSNNEIVYSKPITDNKKINMLLTPNLSLIVFNFPFESFETSDVYIRITNENDIELYNEKFELDLELLNPEIKDAYFCLCYNDFKKDINEEEK